MTYGALDDTEGTVPQQHRVIRVPLFTFLCVLTFASAASASEELWQAAERMEPLVEAAQDRAEASDASTELGLRLHEEGLAAHEEYRGYLKQLLGLTPPIHEADQQVVLGTLLTSLEAGAVLRLRMGACAEARVRLQHLAGLEEVRARPGLLEVTEARALDAAACLLAQEAARVVALSATQLEIRVVVEHPSARRGPRPVVLASGGAALLAGGVLAGVSRHNLQSARNMAATGQGTVPEYDSARHRGSRSAAASSALCVAGVLAAAVSFAGRGERLQALVGPTGGELTLRW